jgi:superfamily II DNA or RNA helicase
VNDGLFSQLNPNIVDNMSLRVPQREGYRSIAEHYTQPNSEREVGIVLPVGCGKSGLIAIAPFAVGARRALVIAPNLKIAAQLYSDFNPAEANMFYQKCGILPGVPYPEPSEIRGTTTNRGDLEASDVVVTNIQQVQGEENRWLRSLPEDFFDLILFDEGHHNVADSWELLRSKFPQAKIINFSATPTRSDGQLMAGKVIYSYPVRSAIEAGYIKRLKAVVLNPETLRYVRTDTGNEVDVPLDEVRRLGEDDADFRRSIVSSAETLKTIIDTSIRELRRRREETSDERHKIIASALNFSHCIQVVEAYRARNLRADYVHSNQDGPANERVLQKLRNHELDAIVQVRKLGEGFDHPYLSVAAVCSIFSNLSPFVQFVGRIMRVIEQNTADSIQNRGVVVFHAGSNIARQWADFQKFSQADQEYFDQLLPLEELDFREAKELELKPDERGGPRVNVVEIMGQVGVRLEEISLIDVPEVQQAMEILVRRGVTAESFQELLKAVPITKVATRQAARKGLDERIRNEAGRVLGQKGINPMGMDLDRSKSRPNFVVLKSAIDRKCNMLVGRRPQERSEFTQAELDQIGGQLDQLIAEATQEVFDGKA